MKKLIFIFIILKLLSCQNHAQNAEFFDKIPLDTSKWVITQKIYLDLNLDGSRDVILIFDKYKGLTRPNNVQTPILIYLGSSANKFSFLKKSEKLIFSPYFEIKTVDNTIMLTQKGVGNDKNMYANYFKYVNEDLIMFKVIVLKKVEKLKVNEETGDVTTTSVKIDTIVNETTNIPFDKYDFNKLKERLNH